MNEKADNRRLKIQSEFPVQKKIIEKKNIIENLANNNYKKSNDGRPKLESHHKKIDRIRIYCTKEEKKIIYKKFKDSGKMREYLLSYESGGE